MRNYRIETEYGKAYPHYTKEQLTEMANRGEPLDLTPEMIEKAEEARFRIERRLSMGLFHAEQYPEKPELLHLLKLNQARLRFPVHYNECIRKNPMRILSEWLSCGCIAACLVIVLTLSSAPTTTSPKQCPPKP